MPRYSCNILRTMRVDIGMYICKKINKINTAQGSARKGFGSFICRYINSQAQVSYPRIEMWL